MGIVTAVYAGLVASLLGGSHYNIVGPTGALSGIIATFVITNGVDMLPTLTIMSGVVIFLAYLMKLEKYLIFVPGSAIHGFTLGVAFIIGLNQLNFALGLQGLEKHEAFIHNVVTSLQHFSAVVPESVVLFTCGLISLLVAKRLYPSLPGAIILAPLGIILGLLSQNDLVPWNIQTLGELYPHMGFALFLPYKWQLTTQAIVPALTIALVAILETMLSAKIADGMTKTKYHKRTEMRGLALANLASGLMGGMPATAALARTSLNIKTGANDRMSGIISGICIILISAFLLVYFKFIPLAIIAAILVFVAINMIEVKHFHHMWQHERNSFFVSMAVACITIFEDPIIGIMFGVAIASLLLLRKLSRGQFDLVLNSNQKMTGHIAGDKLQDILQDTDTIIYSFEGLICYLNSEAHSAHLQKLQSVKKVILRFRSVHYIDLDGVAVIDEIIENIQKQNKEVYLTSINPIVQEMLENSATYNKLVATKHVFPKSADVLRKFGFKI